MKEPFQGSEEWQYAVKTFTPLEQMRIQKYEYAQYKFGFLTLLFILDKYEKEEKYRECFLVWYVLDKHNRVLNDNLPTRLSEDAEEDYYVEFWRLGYGGEVARANMPSYINEVLQSVENLFEKMK